MHTWNLIKQLLLSNSRVSQWRYFNQRRQCFQRLTWPRSQFFTRIFFLANRTRTDACTASPFPARACAGRASYVDGRQWRAGNNGDGEKGGKMATVASVRTDGRGGGGWGRNGSLLRDGAKRGRRGMQNETNDESRVSGWRDAKGYHLTCSWIAIGKNDERLSPRVLSVASSLPTLPPPPGILSVASTSRSLNYFQPKETRVECHYPDGISGGMSSKFTLKIVRR